ncbi:CsbD family protein [Microcoleus sp. FACHB-1515]|uniref:CsbD family protein n=1 Tax=Cyanophyceae TaxID=3028117 RepID=UPI001689DA7F|nr:CsbD family protein [Microcoleus sp. FACHB-1515]MBD2092149.1 CsbD family protein [Microcoleus sp. FACHB-1515]
MSLFQRGRKLAIAIVAVVIVLLVSVPAKAIAASLSNSQLVASTEIERRAEAADRELEGYMQKENGDAVGSPADQVAGRAKQATGAAQTRLEDATSEAKEQGESLVDRVKEFFESDD